jgi:hypothetical protein
MTLSIMTLSIQKIDADSPNTQCHFKCRYAVCHLCFNVIILSVISTQCRSAKYSFMLSIDNAECCIFIIIVLSVIMLSVIMPSVVAPSDLS